jgi:hypothetical protein
MIDQSAILQGDALRAEIAAKVAAYEAEFGSVQTLPIRADDKRVPYRISCPEKKQAAMTKGRDKLNATRTAERQRNSERIGAMLKLGVSVKIICERTGLAMRTVRRIMAEDGLMP